MFRTSRTARIVVLAAVVVPAVSSPAVAASPTRGAVYAHGSPGDNTAVELRVSPRGSRFADIDVALFMPCTNGRRALGSFLWFAGLSRPARVPIKRDGTFSQAFVDQEHFNPFAVAEEYWLSGRFIRSGKAARVVVRARHVGEAGTVCDSGDRRVTARRQASPSVRGHVLARESSSRDTEAVHPGHVDGQVDRARAHIRPRHAQAEQVEGGTAGGPALLRGTRLSRHAQASPSNQAKLHIPLPRNRLEYRLRVGRRDLREKTWPTPIHACCRLGLG